MAGVILAVLILTNLPYWIATRASGSEYVFGGFLLNPVDGNTYLAKMYEGWRGEWRFTLPYTSQPGSGAYLFPFYLLLGHVAYWLALPLALVFHLARILATLFMLVALKRFISRLMPNRKTAWLAFCLAVLGSGIGWLGVPFGAFTADFWVAEAYPFLSAYANPHFPLALGLLVWILTAAINPRPLSLRDGLLLGLAALALALIAPFGVVIALEVFVGYALWELAINAANLARASLVRSLSPTAQLFFWVFIFGVPVSIYEYWVANHDPILAGWNAQNLTPAPPVWDLVVSFFPVLLLAALRGWAVAKKKVSPPSRGERLLWVWAGLGIILIYLPFGLQRRLILGLYIPLAGLAALGIDALASNLGERVRLVITATFLLALPTNLLILLAALHGIQTHDPLLYLTQGEANAFSWIEENTPVHALILAGPQTGLFIPAYTGRRVIYGHPFETVNAQAAKAQVDHFFNGHGGLTDPVSSQEMQSILDRWRVDYIFEGPREKALGGAPDLDQYPAVYSSEGVSIYALER
jgi:hypothetical protein